VTGPLLAFLALSAVVIVTPGQDTALTIRNTLLGRRVAGVATALGVACGQAAWTVAASVGVTGILVASEPAFLALRIGGAGYLAYLGLRSLQAAFRGSGAYHGPAVISGPRLPAARAWRQGLLSSLGNPKLAIFFSSLLPPFAAPGAAALPSMLGLGAIFIAMTVAWLALYAAVVDRAGDVLRRGRVRRALDALTGSVLLVFGLRLATSEAGH
jgi:threonine/homoserine/homoserine lactone efflux protein